MTVHPHSTVQIALDAARDNMPIRSDKIKRFLSHYTNTTWTDRGITLLEFIRDEELCIEDQLTVLYIFYNQLTGYENRPVVDSIRKITNMWESAWLNIDPAYRAEYQGDNPIIISTFALLN